MPGSRSESKIFSDDVLDSSYHFRWVSIRNLLYISFSYSSHPFQFDIFNALRQAQVTLFNFIFVAIVIGMTYMCVDLFIKQYTRRMDWNQNLSPLLKGITLSLILQSTMFSILHIRYVGDGARFLMSSLATTPAWSLCPKNFTGPCLDTADVLHRCERPNASGRVYLNVTSVHIHYMKHFKAYETTLITWRLFASAVIWILNFCLTSISDSIALQFYKYVLYCKIVCSCFIWSFLVICTGRGNEAFMQLMNINVNTSIIDTVNCVAVVYGVGRIGVYDFGCTSPFTMVDNAVLIFTVCFTLFAIVRSMIAKMLILEMTRCVDINYVNQSWHYILFALLPLASEFLYGQKLITLFLYIHLTLTLVPYLMLYTSTTSRLIHSEFPSVKRIYIEGLLCFVGFCLSSPILVVDEYFTKVKQGLYYGFLTASFYLGALRMAIIMWVYGVRKFCTDINFWLGFTPTRFWTVSWAVLPALLFIIFGYEMYDLISILEDKIKFSVALAWLLMAVFVAFVSKLRTIIHYVMENNLVGAFRSKKKYGPIDAEDRKRRRRYDVTVAHRMCFHGCITLDEDIDCNHLPLMNTGESIAGDNSESSLTQMYKESASPRSLSVMTVMDIKIDSKEKVA